MEQLETQTWDEPQLESARAHIECQQLPLTVCGDNQVASFRSAFTEMNVQWASDEAVASLFSDRVIFRGAFSDAEVRGKAAVLDALNNGNASVGV